MDRLERPKSIVIYDGECGFCNRLCVWVARRDHPRHIEFMSQSYAAQTDVERLRIGQALGVKGDTIVLLDHAGVWTRSDAVLRTVLLLPRWSAVAQVFLWIPRVLRDAAYRLVALVRSRLGDGVCQLPDADIRSRFTNLSRSPSDR
jgi:predicted DCC family thiol-disulfide oxidoreductase YuxK